MIRRLLPATLLLLAACGADSGLSGPTEPPPTNPPPTTDPFVEVVLPDDPDTIVLQVDVGVNQPDPLAIATGYPYFTLYRDGRLIVRDRGVGSGVLPPLVIARLTPAGVDALVATAIAGGALDPLDSYGSPSIGDADGVGFVVVTADRRSEFGVYGLGSEGNEHDEITDEQLAGRRELLDLRSRLLDWESLVAGEIAEPPVLFTGDVVLAISDRRFDVESSDLPFDPTENGEWYPNRVDRVFCAELVVADSPGLIEMLIADDFSRLTGLEFRQALPHEPGCEITSDQ